MYESTSYRHIIIETVYFTNRSVQRERHLNKKRNIFRPQEWFWDTNQERTNFIKEITKYSPIIGSFAQSYHE